MNKTRKEPRQGRIRADIRPPLGSEAERPSRLSATIGKLRTPCPAVRTRFVDDLDVTEIRTLSASSRSGVRTCATCGAARVPVLQTIRDGIPIQAWQYSPHFPPIDDRRG